ncbi:methionine synthase [Methanonatronarchaeum sp. AMET6-2]|uniref:methionine synthase n=1 Tax=Methanonatronarchaeum sp. AMET6-2 TaxID=2933293 RepID=UPI001207DFE5|nr:methionine synthase [Methanonatronarchaeum sp. AMET6-2]RZN60988.1 MAG: methionine synthase [Methanonatronarchaeia archaeon]UOY10682.1 methionine synthase [Methanonatronarchaeum sp. AMET6-2]
MIDKLFPTTIIGSYPKPKWLNRIKDLHSDGEVSDKVLKEAEDDASRLIIREHQRAEIEILNDGEMRREEMVEYFAEMIPGYEFHGPVRVWGNNYFNKPSVVEELGDPEPMLVDEFKFTKDVVDEDSYIKIPITSPYTIAEWSFNEVYNKEDLIYRLAEIINREIKLLEEAGARCIQIDEPALSTRPEDMEIIKEAVSIVTDGVNLDKIIMHACYGDFSTIYPEMLEFDVDQFSLEFANNEYESLDIFSEYDFTKEIGYGCIDVHNKEIESVQQIKNDIKKGFEVFEPEKMWINPDCGVKLLPRETAYKKLSNMSKAAQELRMEMQ